MENAQLRRENAAMAAWLRNSGVPQDFDPDLYLWRNPDVAAAGMPAIEHFLRYGHREKRNWSGPPPERRAAHALPAGTELHQQFLAPRDGLTGVTLTFLPPAQPSVVRVRLCLHACAEDGVANAEPIAACDLILQPHEAKAALRFDAIGDSRDRRFLLVVACSNEPAQARALLFSSAEERIDGHRVCTLGERDLGAFGVTAGLDFARPFSPTIRPRGFLYSPVTQCNLNCIHCISKSTRRSVSRVSDHIKEKLREWCADGTVESVGTDYSGDILWADHRWPGELDYLISLGVPFHIDTNAAYLTPERVEKLVKSRLASLNVSLDGAQEETHRRIRRGTPGLQTVLDNVRHFSHRRLARDVESRITLSLGFTLMRSNIDELMRFVEIGLEVGADEIMCRHVEAYEPAMEAESLWFDKEKYNAVRAEVAAFAARRNIDVTMPEPFTDEVTTSGHDDCEEPWRSVAILGNGDVQVCCVPTTKIGNLYEESMEEIWNSERYQAFRLAVNSDRPPPQCAACPLFGHTSNVNSYLPHRVMDTWVEPYASKP